jgi:predicted transcriptional regulator
MSKTRLSELQIAVVQVLWERDGATVADIRDALADRDLATTTVATVLKRLTDADVVTRRKDGRAYVYRAAVSQRDVRRSMVGDLVDWLFGGNSEALVSHLVHESDVDPAELDRLRQRVATAPPQDDASAAPPASDASERSNSDASNSDASDSDA